jgi:hypothetical protein
MSLEAKIEALTAAVVALTAKLGSVNVSAPAPVAQAPAPVAAPAPVYVAPVAPPAPAMPAPPTFMTPPAPAAAVTGAPFSDGKGLIDYVMGCLQGTWSAERRHDSGRLDWSGLPEHQRRAARALRCVVRWC